MNNVLSNIGKITTMDKKYQNISKYDRFYYDSINSFLDEFIYPRMITEDIVIGWHNMLMSYVDLDNNTLFLRTGNSAGHLRRGWMTKYVCENHSFTIVFSDNDLATIIYKMALDGFIPDINEFYNALTTFDTWDVISKSWDTAAHINNEIDKTYKVPRKFIKFPVHFSRSGGNTYPDQYENEMNSSLLSCKSCCIGSLGYKHSHIYHAGKDFYLNGNVLGMSNITANYITLGEVSDYKWDSSICNYIRVINISDKNKFNELKKIAVAGTLRFIDPLNHFLAPKSEENFFIINDKVIKKDVAEEQIILNHLSNKIHDQYKTKINIDKFYNKALIKFNYNKLYSNSFKIILINDSYKSSKINNSKKVTTNKASVSKTVSTTKLNNKPIVKKIMEDLESSGKLTASLINQLTEQTYSSKTFKISYPLLCEKAKVIKDRYYKDIVINFNGKEYLVCSQWKSSGPNINIDKLENWYKSLI